MLIEANMNISYHINNPKIPNDSNTPTNLYKPYSIMKSRTR